jgi:hypothetical protein
MLEIIMLEPLVDSSSLLAALVVCIIPWLNNALHPTGFQRIEKNQWELSEVWGFINVSSICLHPFSWVQVRHQGNTEYLDVIPLSGLVQPVNPDNITPQDWNSKLIMQPISLELETIFS